MVKNSAVLFCGLAVAIFLGGLIGAAILQLSCVVYNLFAGISDKQAGAEAVWLPTHPLKSDEECAVYDRIAAAPGVPRPGFDRAVRIVLVATLINAPATFILFQMLRLAAEVTGYNFGGRVSVACVALLMGVLVLAGINSAMLPTRYGKGLWVSLLSHFMAASLAGAIGVIALTFNLSGVIGSPW